MALEMRLLSLVQNSSWIADVLGACSSLSIKDYYVAGGAVTQIVWNQLVGRPVHDQVKDVDVVYFDANHSLEDQRHLEETLSHILANKVPLDLKNQALVHLWYPLKFGYSILPYRRTEDGIDTWLSAFAIGVRFERSRLSVYAPFGVDDLFSMTIRPNRRQITQSIYSQMVESFSRRWPEVTVEPW
jgi:hypothetical protein